MDQKITAIKRQKKNPERLNIYLDGEFAFGLSRIVAAWLVVGQYLSQEKITALQAEDVVETAYQKALRFLSYRARSEKEMRDKLSNGGYDATVVNTVLDRLRNKGYIKDDDFARQWVENRTLFRPRGKRALTVELRLKGVPDNVIYETVESLVDEKSIAYDLALQRSRRVKSDTWQEFRSHLGAYLYRRGFSYDTIFEVVEKVWSEIHGGDDERSNTTNDNED